MRAPTKPPQREQCCKQVPHQKRTRRKCRSVPPPPPKKALTLGRRKIKEYGKKSRKTRGGETEQGDKR